MSAQFGKCNFDGKSVDPKDLDQVRPMLTPYGPDGEGYICKDNFGIIYRAFHTTRESRLEKQPHVSPSGAVITWDGRLDNREELIGQLGGQLSTGSPDLSIVAAAYERWGNDTFARLIGDWAVSICDPSNRSLVFAKDFVGTRHLYYSVEKDEVTWCTILDPLVRFASRSFALDEEYIAGWLSFFPAAHLTPYVGVHSVPPSSFVLLRPGERTVQKHWDFHPRRIRYQADAEYEEHFRFAFSEAVRRRLRSNSPVLAELSGGMDSSSIVCMADTIIATGGAETSRLDTVSYYNDSEPNWNERPFFAKVEEKRGRKGCHIDVESHQCLRLEFRCDGFAPTPEAIVRPSETATQIAACMNLQQNRVLLSGIGGDEVTGGVPTPLPELEDLLARAHFGTLARRLKVWALNKRIPWFHLFSEAVRGFLPSAVVGVPAHKRPAPWIDPSFAKRNYLAFQGYEGKLTLFGPLPSFQENIWALQALRRQLGCDPLPAEPVHERRYPYLDRDFVEFMYSIPREQLVRPGQRRSLMRRALVGIVPSDLLNRKRKAYVSKGPMSQIAAELQSFLDFSNEMVSGSLRVLDTSRFADTLRAVGRAQEVPIVLVMRTIALEMWLRHVEMWSSSHSSNLIKADVELQRFPRERQTGQPFRSGFLLS